MYGEYGHAIGDGNGDGVFFQIVQHSMVPIVLLGMIIASYPQCKASTATCPESDISTDHQFFPLRNDISPCPACGEIFQKSQIPEQHKHAISELIDGDSRNNIVRIISKTGWTNNEKIPEIHRILKIHYQPALYITAPPLTPPLLPPPLPPPVNPLLVASH